MMRSPARWNAAWARSGAMRPCSTDPAISRNALGRHARTAPSQLRNDPGLSHVMTGLDPAIHALLWMWPRRGYPACAGHDCVWFERARVTLVQIQLSNSHCASDMRHRPHCLRRGAPSSLAFPRPLVRGRAERQVPVAPLGLMRCGLPQSSVHQDFRRRRASARRSACGVFSVACTLPQRTIRSPN